MTLCSDLLAGTSNYGTYVSSPTASTGFSVPFSPTANTNMLFMTGDGQYWGITTYGTISAATSSSGTTITWQQSSASPCKLLGAT